MKKNKHLLVAFLLVAGIATAQTGIGTINPDASAQLDVVSVNKGLLIPRMSTTERNSIANPANGLMIYNTTTNSLEVNKGTTITPLWTATTGAQGIQGTTGATGATGPAGTTSATGLTGILPIANGGTNSSATPTNGGIAYGTGTANSYTAAGTAGQVLTSNGAAEPTWSSGGTWFSAISNIASAGINYTSLNGSTFISASGQRLTYFPVAGTLDRLHVYLYNGSITANTCTVTIYKNGLPTSMTVGSLSLAGGVGNTAIASDTTHPVSISAGDKIEIALTNSTVTSGGSCYYNITTHFR